MMQLGNWVNNKILQYYIYKRETWKLCHLCRHYAVCL